MTHDTIIDYKDCDGQERKRITKMFDSQTPFCAFITWILTWLRGNFAFDLQIKDPKLNEYVDFNEQYLQERNPYLIQPVLPRIDLRVLPTRGGLYRTSTFSTGQETLNTTTPIITQQLKAPHDVTINKHDPCIIFVKNVNNEQRDQYGDSCLCIQGEKMNLEGDTKKGRVIPMIKVKLDNIPQEKRFGLQLISILVWEICQDGLRKLCYHPDRELVTNLPEHNLVKNSLTEKMLGNGDDLILKTKEIRGSKTLPNAKKTLICSITNRYSADTTYETSRLACLLTQDGNLMWDTLVLSDAMIFTKTSYMIECIDVIENNIVVEKILVRKYAAKRKQNLNHGVETVELPSKVKKPEQADNQINRRRNNNLSNSINSCLLDTINSTPDDNDQFFNINSQALLDSRVVPSNPTTINYRNSQKITSTTTLPAIYQLLDTVQTNCDFDSAGEKDRTMSQEKVTLTLDSPFCLSPSIYSIQSTSDSDYSPNKLSNLPDINVSLEDLFGDYQTFDSTH